MKLVRWKRFTWDLKNLPNVDSGLPSHFQVRHAGKEDFKATRDVVLSSFSLDATWSDTFKMFSGLLEDQLEAAFSKTPGTVVVISHGQRIIAASLLSTDPEADNHLLSGPCVFMEYRSRGIGSALLYQSLKELQQAGLPEAHGVCKELAPTSKFVYKKFNSTSGPYDFERALAELR